MKDSDFGQLVSLEDIHLPEPPIEHQDGTSTVSSVGNDLWFYHNRGVLHGIPVADDAVGLPLDREDMLDVVFLLKRTPKSKIFWISPEEADSIKMYDGLLQEQADGKLIILDELKQYDTSKCKFMVWVRYDELVYELNPRFEYLREELNNG